MSFNESHIRAASRIHRVVHKYIYITLRHLVTSNNYDNNSDAIKLFMNLLKTDLHEMKTNDENRIYTIRVSRTRQMYAPNNKKIQRFFLGALYRNKTHLMHTFQSMNIEAETRSIVHSMAHTIERKRNAQK